MPATTTTRGVPMPSGGAAASVRAARHWAGNSASARRASCGSPCASARGSSRFLAFGSPLTRSSLAIDVPVDEGRREPQPLDERAQLLDEGDRAVPAPRAAHRDGQVRLALALVRGEHEAQEVLDVAQQLAAFRVLHHELADLVLAAVERAQVLDEVRVGQETDVEDEVGVERYAVLEAEGHERDGEARTLLGRHVRLDEHVLELVHGHARGVHDTIGHLAHGTQRLALGADTVEDVAVGRQRSEEHTSELQSQSNLVCRLLLEKKKKKVLYSITAAAV